MSEVAVQTSSSITPFQSLVVASDSSFPDLNVQASPSFHQCLQTFSAALLQIKHLGEWKTLVPLPESVSSEFIRSQRVIATDLQARTVPKQSAFAPFFQENVGKHIAPGFR